MGGVNKRYVLSGAGGLPAARGQVGEGARGANVLMRQTLLYCCHLDSPCAGTHTNRRASAEYMPCDVFAK